MKDSFFKKNLPHLIAVIIFMLIAVIYSKPLLEGKKLNTQEQNILSALSKTNLDYEKETGETALWNNNLFSGMPDYTINPPQDENIFQKIFTFITFGESFPLNIIFWYFLGFYILLIVLRINPWLSIAGSLAFGFSSYFFIIIAEGRFSEAWSIGFMAPVIAGIFLAFERKKIYKGILLMTFFLTLQFVAGSIQIIYYTILILIIYCIFKLIAAIKGKYILPFFKTFGILIIGFILALGINAAYLLTINEYLPYSTSGKSELSTSFSNKNHSENISTIDSYGIDETFTLLIPNVKGGASQGQLKENSASYSVIDNFFGKQAAKDVVKKMPVYFGDRSYTSGPVYVGAFIVFLFIFGLIIVKGRIKWWIFTITLISIIFAWGNNIDFLTSFLQNYLPFYNKFTNVSKILIIAEFSIPLLAILAVDKILKGEIERTKLLNYFYIALGITGVLVMIFIISPSVAGLSGKGNNEAELAKYLASYISDGPGYEQEKEEFRLSFINAIYEDRAELIRKDGLRSLLFIILGAAIIYLAINKKIKPVVVISAISVIIITDMWTIDKRYLNDNNFSFKRKNPDLFEKTIADNYILKDDDDHYRVCDITVNTFDDAWTSYYHRSIGGKSNYKIKRYEELYDSLMWRELQITSYLINAGRQNGFDEDEMQGLYSSQSNTPILNMLNSKYIIYNSQQKPLVNNKALGNAWFIDDYKLVNNPDEEIIQLRKINPANEAIISKQFLQHLDGFKFRKDTLATIYLSEISPNNIIYHSRTAYEQLALFSEIYYQKGWKVTIDGEEKEHFRANYILRAMRIPAGNHTIEFYFHPESYKSGVIISYICAALFMVIVLGLFFVEIREKRKNNTR